MHLMSPEGQIYNLNTQWRLSADDEQLFSKKWTKTTDSKKFFILSKKQKPKQRMFVFRLSLLLSHMSYTLIDCI
jgi:hypothetical protein